jgi:Xaa-Pro aminopeptidase
MGHAPATPMMPTLNYTDAYIPRLVAEDIQKNGHKRVGFVALATIPASMYKCLTETLPNVEFVDATDVVDGIKAIKSPYELSCLKKAVKIHDQIYSAMPCLFRPGRYEYEITSDIRKLAGDLGAECTVNVSIGTDAVMPVKQTLPLQYRRVERGDLMFCLVEVNAEGGCYGELLRVVSLGPPPEAFVKASETAVAATAMLEGLLRPGTPARDLLAANNAFMQERGYFAEGRLFGHGQGYDMVERPAFVAAETMALARDMFVTMHPGAANPQALGLSCNSYIITDDGFDKLTKTPDGILVV